MLFRLAVFVVAMLATAHLAQADMLKLAHGYRVNLPQGLAAKRIKVADYEIISIKRDDQVVLTIYLGNHPNFPDKLKTNLITEVLIRDTPLQECKVQNTNFISCEMLLRMDSQKWPAFAHFYYSLNLETSDYAKVRDLIGSLSGGAPKEAPKK